MSHPTPWRDCPHTAHRLVSSRAVKDPWERAGRVDAIKAHIARGDGYRVAVCVGCGMRWFRVQRIRRGRDPWTNQPIEKEGGHDS